MNPKHTPPDFPLPPVYPITDKSLARIRDHYGILKELVYGGASFVQIRDKSTPLRELAADIERCVEFASDRNVALILNDRCDLVLSCGASGVHLGREDLPPESARMILGKDKIIGFSTHSIRQVREAQTLPVQYLGFGPVYRTSTKNDAAPIVGLKTLGKACRESRLPLIAIGGIGIEQVREVLRAGAAGVAVISALMTAPDIAHRMHDFLSAAMER